MSSAELLAHLHGKTRIPGFLNPPFFQSVLNSLPLAHASGSFQLQWRRDPRSGYEWPLDYHRDIKLLRTDGSDVRVLWELNRLGHFLTLARSYSLTRDERYAAEFFTQLQSWIEQNPYGRGPNWNCAMEVALRAMNLLAAFEVFRHSAHLQAAMLQSLLLLLQQHGRHIERN